ncbi:MAG: response regulator transcription factor [Coriobacteriales bacterium]|jgi:DNA-binding response OmpR family regulator|nr:response regulator transcription factor [Coriobacteriales bacterium]
MSNRCLPNKGNILLVEDNADLNRANRRLLALQGYTVRVALTAAEARRQLAVLEPDVILLDVMLPDDDGFCLCDEIRRTTSAHIIFLTAKTEHADLVRGLACGGDDYIMKPFHHDELLARVEAAIRRRRMDKAPTQTLTKGALTLDIVANQAFLNNTNLLLTPKEFALLLVLVQSEGKTLSADFLYERVWKQPIAGDRSALKTAISRLRTKIAVGGFDIISQRRQGYTFEASE